ncbi:hypothetical protein SDC9_185493 [bioreactor metagenome]|uniref:Uncharacterized protein n=1 Tax=bioreactor metagenome TaxID=1076179 RepID=A0A645HHV4_9ZZZZ
MDSLTKVMLANGEVEPPMPPEILVHAQKGYETAALRKLSELSEEGILCEFSIFESLEEAKAYAEKRCISKIFSLGKGIEIYEI